MSSISQRGKKRILGPIQILYPPSKQAMVKKTDENSIGCVSQNVCKQLAMWEQCSDLVHTFISLAATDNDPNFFSRNIT